MKIKIKDMKYEDVLARPVEKHKSPLRTNIVFTSDGFVGKSGLMREGI